MQEKTSRFKAPPWHLTLRAYLRDLPVHAELTMDQSRAILQTKDFLERCRKDNLCRDRFEERPAPWSPHLRFLTRKTPSHLDSILVYPRSGNALLGGAFKGVPYVFEAYRGRQLGAEIVYFSDMHGGVGLCPGSYSLPGYKSRITAWRRHIETVMVLSPEDIPDNVKKDYSRLYPGGA
jgi:hypothetical protein